MGRSPRAGWDKCPSQSDVQNSPATNPQRRRCRISAVHATERFLAINDWCGKLEFPRWRRLRTRQAGRRTSQQRRSFAVSNFAARQVLRLVIWRGYGEFPHDCYAGTVSSQIFQNIACQTCNPTGADPTLQIGRRSGSGDKILCTPASQPPATRRRESAISEPRIFLDP